MKRYFPLLILTAAFFLALPSGFAFGQSCPSQTTVTGTSVNFVGQVTDMGGASTTLVWFEYGQSTSYGQTTPQQSVSQTGIYCITVSNLSPCTTYYYRAAAQNSAGVSYGDNKSFTTTCNSASVNLLANGSENSVTISYGSSANLSWNATNVNSCTASGNWSGSKAISGSQTISNITSNENFTLTCNGSGGTVSDNVSVYVQGTQNTYPVANAGPDLSVPESQTILLQGTGYNPAGGQVTYSWSCNGGTLSNNYTSQPVFYPPNVGSNTNYSCTLTVTNSQGLTSSDSTNVLVTNQTQTPSNFYVNNLVADLSNGTSFADSVTASPSDVLGFSIAVTAGNSSLQGITVRDTLPSNVVWRVGSLTLNGTPISGDITSGVNIGDFSAGQTKTITFNADVKNASNFNYGQTQLTNTALAYNSLVSASDNSTVTVNKTAVEGTSTATAVSTGWTNNIWLDTIIFPLLIALLGIFLFKTRILRAEEWIDGRKDGYRQYKSNKTLSEKILKAKNDDILGKK